MTQVLMTLTKGQGHRSRSNVQKLAKIYKMGNISDSEAILPTDFILGTKVQPNKAHSMTQVPMTLALGQGHRSRSNFSKMGKKNKELAISRTADAISPTDFILGTKVQLYNAHWSRSKVKVKFPPKW